MGRVYRVHGDDYNALSSENPEEAIQALTEAMPEQAEKIKLFAEIIFIMSEQSEE